MPIHNEFIYDNIKISLNGSSANIPFIKVKSNIKGPKICITAGIHGDEIGGTVIVQELLNKLHNCPIIKGELNIFPMLNPLGFEQSNRHLNGEDLNRVFPGKKQDTLAKKTAHIIFNKILEENPDFAIDIHNDWRKSIQYAVIDPKPKNTKNEVYLKTKKIAKGINLPIVLDTDEIENSLSYHLLKNNIPSIVLELGSYQIVKEREIEKGVKILLTFLKYFNMISLEFKEKDDIKRVKGKILRYSQKPLPKKKGIARFSIAPGQIVKKGQILAKIYDSLGNLLEVLKSPNNSIILGYSDSSLALPGKQLIASGII